MSLLDLFKSDEEESKTPLLDALSHPEEAPAGLPQNVQEYVDDLGQTLGYPEGSMKTKEDWDALNQQESAKLQEEEEGRLMNSAVSAGMNGAGIEGFKESAATLAGVQKTGTIPHAAAISATREDLAESDVNNPSNLQYPAGWKGVQQMLLENRAIVKSMRMRSENRASEASWSELGKDLLGTAGGIEAVRAKKAVNALGLKGSSLIKESFPETVENLSSRTNAAYYFNIFSAFINNVETTRTPAEVLEIVQDIEDLWDKEGVNPYLQAELWRQAERYSPGFATFNAASLGLASLYAGKAAATAVTAAKNGLYRTAAKYTAKAAGELGQIPFTDTIVETTFKGVNRVVKMPKTTDEISKVLEKALKTKDRAIISDTAKEIFGAPTVDRAVLKAENKDGIIRYFVDDIAMPTTSPERTVANSADVIAAKIEKGYRERLNAAISDLQKINEVKRDIINFTWGDIVDSLDLNNLPGIGRGTYGEKIVGFSDILETKKGHQVFLLRLSDEEKPASGLLSRIVKGKDRGRQEAEKIGKQMTAALQVTNSGLDKSKQVGLGYRVEKRNGYWIPTIEIDTHKGWGTLNYEDLMRRGAIKQEHWRPFASSIATFTGNPSDIQIADIIRTTQSGLMKNTGVAAEEMFKSLPKEEKAIVQALYDLSTMYGAWYSPEHLLARGVSPQAVETYIAGKLVNDFSYFVMNRVERADLITKGGKKVYFNDKEVEGVVRPMYNYHNASQLKEAIGDRKVLIDAIEGTPHALTDEDRIKDLYRKGYILIEPSISPDSTVAAKSFYYLLNPQSTVINDLGTFVMTYVPGGRRFFDRRATYLKQLVMSEIGEEDNIRLAITGMQTFFADLDEAGMVERAAWLNRIRDAYIDGDIALTNSIIGEKSISKVPFKDAESFKAWADEIGLDIVHKGNRLEAVKRDRMLRSYEEFLGNRTVDDLVGMENMKAFAKNSHFQAITNEAKLQRAKRTGRELFTWDFDVAQPVDFEMQMRYLVNDMVEADIMGSYTQMYADRFAEEFKSVLILSENNTELTPLELLNKGRIRENLTAEEARVAEQCESARKYYTFIRGNATDLDTEVAKTARSFFRWIGAPLKPGVSEAFEGVAHKVRVNWEKFNSLPFLQYQRTLAAHWYLGMFNISQFWKQAAQDVSLTLLDPSAREFAGDAFKLVPVLLKSNGSKFEAVRLAKEAFKNDPKMLNNALNVIDMGLFEHGTAGGFLERGQTVSSKASKLSFMPFNWGEMHPRILSGLTALNREGLYGTRASYAQLRKPMLYAKSLYMNMDATGMSRIQSSQIAQTLMQFMNPRLRWLETVLFDTNLTPAQRGRLFIGTWLLTGSQGLFGRGIDSWVCNNVYRLFHNENEEELPALKDRQNIWQYMWDLGVDTVRRGIPNTISDRTGLGVNLVSPLEVEIGGFYDLITRAADLDIVSYQVLGKFGKSVINGYSVAKNLLMGEVTSDEFRKDLDKFLANAPSSFKPVLAYNMYRTGEMLNAKGELVDRMNSKLQAFLVAIGFEKLSYSKLAEYYADFHDHSKYMKALEDELYEAALDCANYNLQKDWDVLNTTIKTSNLADIDRATVLERVWKRVADVVGTSKVERAIYDQYVRGGTYGTNFIRRGESN